MKRTPRERAESTVRSRNIAEEERREIEKDELLARIEALEAENAKLIDLASYLQETLTEAASGHWPKHKIGLALDRANAALGEKP